MRLIAFMAVAALLVAATDIASGSERVLRETGATQGTLLPDRDGTNGSDAMERLRYGSRAVPPYFMTIPNDFNDNFYNVRFTPTIDPVYLIGVYLCVFDMDSLVDRNGRPTGGPAGTPGVQIRVYESDQDGYPTDTIRTKNFPYISEQDDTLKQCRPSNLLWNFLDLRPLRIGWQSRDHDFHVALTLFADQDTDTLAIFHDAGRRADSTDRSGLFDGQDSVWVKMVELQGIRLGLNFYMYALISDVEGGDFDPPPYVSVADFGIPENYTLLAPAYPNPFNSTTKLSFSVEENNPYQLKLFDRQGRQIRLLGEGSGGSGIISFDAASLASGTYFITLTTPKGTISQPINLIR